MSTVEVLHEGAPSSESIEQMQVVGDATINNERFAFGSTEEFPNIFAGLAILEPATLRPVVPPDIAYLNVIPLHGMDMSKKRPVYEVMSQPHTFGERTARLLARATGKEPPIIGTATILSKDKVLGETLADSWRRNNPTIEEPLAWAWQLVVKHAITPAQMEALGITPDELYEGKKREEEKRTLSPHQDEDSTIEYDPGREIDKLIKKHEGVVPLREDVEKLARLETVEQIDRRAKGTTTTKGSARITNIGIVNAYKKK